MQLYLIRHAHAVDADEDPERPLSKRGVEQVESLASFLRRSRLFLPAEFWHSSLARSRQTTELLSQRLRLEVPHTLMPDLEPEDDPRAAARRIKAVAHSLAIVGHEPHLSMLATLLVVGKMEFPVFVMKKCSALALEGEGAHWSVRWHVSPDLIA
jgi:phosphohistidine phosphatase